MLKYIKFLDVQSVALHNKVRHRDQPSTDSFQIHLFDFSNNSDNIVRVMNMTGSQDLVSYFMILKMLLPEKGREMLEVSKDGNLKKSDPSCMQAYCKSLLHDYTSRIELCFYSGDPAGSFSNNDLITYTIAFNKQGLVYEQQYSNGEQLKSVFRYSNDIFPYSFRLNNDLHIDYVRKNLMLMNLADKNQVDIHIAQVANLLSNNSIIVAKDKNNDYKLFVIGLYQYLGYDVTDIDGISITYSGGQHIEEIYEELDDVRYIYALSLLLYCSFILGGVVIVDNFDLLDHATMISIINMFKKGLKDRNTAQLIFSTAEIVVAKTPYSFSKDKWVRYL